MASEVYTIEYATLQDETDVELRPLPIAKLRKFMKLWQDHVDKLVEDLERQPAEGDEEAQLPLITNHDIAMRQMDVFVKMCALGLESQLKGEKTEKQFIEYLENNLDEPTIYKILKVTGNFVPASGDEPNPNQTTPETNPVAAGTN